jgi:Fur family transcriptional regulator, ferric uptake regulator
MASGLNKKNRSELAKAGLRQTIQREQVFDNLKERSTPVTVGDIHKELFGKQIHMDLSTVYRVLEALEKHGLARRIVIENENSAYYEYTGCGHRHYLVCLGCKKIVSIEKCPVKAYEKDLSKKTDFIIEGHSLMLYGYCPECSRKLRKT